MIFSRNRGGKHSRAQAPGRGGAPEPGGTAEPDTPTGHGPYDVSEAPAGATLFDLGSLRIPAIEGIEVRVQANPDGSIAQVVLVHGDSGLELGVFAAPRSEGIWDEVRAEIQAALIADGATAEEVDGEYGPQLRVRMRTPEGVSDLRFVGVDGPRWMVRAVYQGKAALDPAAAGPLDECLYGLVVDRGSEALPVRDALPLRLPKEFAEQAAQAQAQAQAGGTAGTGGAAPGRT